MMKRKLSIVDDLTGEVMGGIPVYVHTSRRPTLYGDRWIQMSQDAALQIATDRELWGLPQAVLLYIEGRLDFENYVNVPQQESADALKVQRPAITKAITKLVGKGILIRGPKLGRSSSYRLNPAYGWKGDNKKAHEYQLELIKGGRE